MVPNEYLVYYYQARRSVQNLQAAGETRGEEIARLNEALFADLKTLHQSGDFAGMESRHQAYLQRRGETYMARETGEKHNLDSFDEKIARAFAGEGYAGVALDLIEGLTGSGPASGGKVMTLNIPNQGAIQGMEAEDVVEIPALAAHGQIRPLAVGQVPSGPLGLMQQVKAYERLTIAAAVECSYPKALQALTIHPLVRDRQAASIILDAYLARHGDYYPDLKHV
jgi:6-phospho-beta-glucosidase